MNGFEEDSIGRLTMFSRKSIHEPKDNICSERDSFATPQPSICSEVILRLGTFSVEFAGFSKVPTKVQKCTLQGDRNRSKWPSDKLVGNVSWVCNPSQTAGTGTCANHGDPEGRRSCDRKQVAGMTNQERPTGTSWTNPHQTAVESTGLSGTN